VREERFAGVCGFGMSRRVISPCPTVHRFVVTQYRRRPTGKLALTMKRTKTRGSAMKIHRWRGSMVVDMKYVEEIWLAT
jgi:hypothetical protein